MLVEIANITYVHYNLTKQTLLASLHCIFFLTMSIVLTKINSFRLSDLTFSTFYSSIFLKALPFQVTQLLSPSSFILNGRNEYDMWFFQMVFQGVIAVYRFNHGLTAKGTYLRRLYLEIGMYGVQYARFA